jgi:quercetin dioxygenase-like cupin family protein
MNASPQSPASPAIPSDDLARKLVVARPEDASLAHVSVAGDTYTILVSGDDTAGRYCLIDMVIPPGGGPPPHRHDFEEMFTLSEGELTFHFRGVQSKIQAGATVNIPANAPHYFKNESAGPARMLCMAAPAGLDAFFLAVGEPGGRANLAFPRAEPSGNRRAPSSSQGACRTIQDRAFDPVKRPKPAPDRKKNQLNSARRRIRCRGAPRSRQGGLASQGFARENAPGLRASS